MPPATTQQQLLEAIYCTPEDDAPRRVYADWLMARGDPRGEFIGLQLDRSRGRATPDAFAREQTLLEQHRIAWSAPFPTSPDRVVFERGFPARVALRLGPTTRTEVRPGPAWSTVEELFVQHPLAEADAGALVEFFDAPQLAGLRRVAAPLDVLEASTEALRRWREALVLDWRWPLEGLVRLAERLPKLETIGAIATYAGELGQLCARPHPLPARVRRLEILWWDNGIAASPMHQFLDLITGSSFDEFRWVDTSCAGELRMRRTEPGPFTAVEGDLHLLEDLDEPAPYDALTQLRVLWTDEHDEADIEYAHALAARTGAALEFETVPSDRPLPRPGLALL